jgi:outer membrane receptor protein involved in Fe transport
MVKRRLFAAVFAAALLLVGFSAFAQTTGTLSGTVTTAGAPLPGATVTISSPALQGVRTTVTGPNGDYTFPALPPGRYTVSAELEGMTKVTQSVNVRLSETTRADADLKVSKVAEAITVTATAPSVLETPQVSTSLTRETVEALPIGRTIAQRIQLAPGVNNDGPNNQTIINGAPSYDNLYMVNGVVVNDSIRGQPENLFIEDAIQETTLLTGGVSAEYGRFTGGVVNTITKSGGNEFTGSFRDNLTNPSWTKVTAFHDPISGAPQPKNISARSNQYEATLGGYILRDRIWFFGAGRKFNQEQSFTTTGTNIPFLNTQDNKRYEAKLTGQITPKHSLVASYLHNNTNETNNRFGTIVDLRSLSNRQLPNWLETFHYSGVITNSLLLEGQFSRRYFAFIGGGGPRDLINGTLLRDNATARRMWSPTFCGECDPKTRNNKDYLAKGNYFLSTQSMGSHNFVAGYDDFHELRHENNYQSGSDFRIWGDFIYVGQNVFFRMKPEDPYYIEWTPINLLSKTSDASTKSVFVNDKWDLNNHWSFNLGVRYDKNNAVDQSRNKTSDDSNVSPRLGLVYDVKGDGKNRVTASYAKYVSHIDNGINDAVAVGGSPGSIYYNYRGPEINTGNAPYLPTDQVIQKIFDWFNSVGGTSGYKSIAGITLPGLTARLKGSLKSPNAQEYALGYGRQIGSNGYARFDYINRHWSDFYVSFTDTSIPHNTAADGSQVDVSLIGNDNNGLSRRYNGLQSQFAYRIARLNLGGNYTWSKLRGNVEGETFNNATVTVGNNDYPEYRKFARNIPVGFLNEDIRHRANVYANYDLGLPWGSLNLGVLERYHTGAPYSAIGNVRTVGVITNPNGFYKTPPTSVQYFFSDRGAFRTDNISETSLTATYNLPTFGRVNVFLRGDVVNIFNQQGVEFTSTALGSVLETRVYTSATAPRAGIAKPVCPTGTPTTVCRNGFYLFNPYTDTPVQFHPGDDPNGHYNYELDPTFGRPTNKDAYQLPRTYRFAVGLRF